MVGGRYIISPAQLKHDRLQMVTGDQSRKEVLYSKALHRKYAFETNIDIYYRNKSHTMYFGNPNYNHHIPYTYILLCISNSDLL